MIASEKGVTMIKTVKMLKNEHWWGGAIDVAQTMPFDENTQTIVKLNGERTFAQCTSLFLSDKGRYIWSDKGYVATFDNGTIKLDGEGDFILDKKGSSLREAFVNAKKNHFPFEGNIHTERDFYMLPQFNTWMELIKDQTEENILAYAEGLVANGYNRGILIIDDGWQAAHGVWRFHPAKFKDPKGMIKKLHQLGFKVMLWVSPWLCPDSDEFLSISTVRGEYYNLDQLLRLKDGTPAIFNWWNGYSAMLDMTKELDRKFMGDQLDILTNEYGVDGFKFDGGDYVWKPINAQDKNAPDLYGKSSTGIGNKTIEELNDAWIRFGLKYPFHEFKNTWNVGHLPVIQRLCDKSHKWGKQMNCFGSLIPEGLFIGLIGNPFVCPDMVGGGSWTAFVYGEVDEELFVRMAECSALFPMMQFSAAPWKKLSKPYADICLKMAKLHEEMYDYILEAVEYSEKTGEPILKSLEYNYPHNGYAYIDDQFMLGDKVLVAPVVKKGQTKREIVFPEGKWIDKTDGKIYSKGKFVVDSPIEKLPYFIKID